MRKRLELICLNSVFWALFVLCTALLITAFTLFVATCALFTSHRYAMKRFRRAISWYGLAVTRVLVFPWIRVDYRLPESPPGDGPFIFVSNHRSSSDAFLMSCLPYECVQIAKNWPMRIPVLGAFARWAGYIAIQQISFEEFIQRGIRLLKEGCSLICFPEGTRSGGRQIGQFHGGIFRLALQAGPPIIPLCISGTENVPARGSLLLRPAKIRVRTLAPLVWKQYRDMTPFQLKNRVRDLMAVELSTLDKSQ